MQLARLFTVPGATAALVVLMVAACGGGSGDGGAAPGGQGPEASSGGAADAGGPESPYEGTSSSSSGSGGPGGTPAPARCTAAAGEYEGIDTTNVKTGTAPAGCVHGYDPQTHTLTITLGGDTPAVLLAAKSGEITANGVTCSTSQGTAATVADAKSIVVKGTPGDETLIVDLSGGALAGLEIDLAGGTDAFMLKGSPGADTIYAAGVKTGIAFDWTGDLAADATVAGGENFTVSLGAGDDAFHADGAKGLGDPATVAFTAYGGAGDDVLHGGPKSDALCGGAGNDTFLAGPSASGDQFEGGDGDDLVDFGGRMAQVAVTLDDVANDGEKDEGADVRANVENISGGAGDDVLVGGPGTNRISGGAGNDTITGGAGDDVLSGDDGDDTFDEESASNGRDVMDGGNGSDTVLYARRTNAVTVDLCTQSAASACSADSGEAAEADTLVNVENASGGSGNDRFTGNAAGNSFYGGAGDDTMEGNDGDDYLYGDDGADTLHGGNGDDYLDGARMVDTFNGGPGQGDICIIEKGEAPVACELY